MYWAWGIGGLTSHRGTRGSLAEPRSTARCSSRRRTSRTALVRRFWLRAGREHPNLLGELCGPIRSHCAGRETSRATRRWSNGAPVELDGRFGSIFAAPACALGARPMPSGACRRPKERRPDAPRLDRRVPVSDSLAQQDRESTAHRRRPRRRRSESPPHRTTAARSAHDAASRNRISAELRVGARRGEIGPRAPVTSRDRSSRPSPQERQESRRASQSVGDRLVVSS